MAAPAAQSGIQLPPQTGGIHVLTQHWDSLHPPLDGDNSPYRSAGLQSLKSASWKQLVGKSRYNFPNTEPVWGNYFQIIQRRFITRGQTFPDSLHRTEATRWEHNPQYHTADGNWYGIAYFPSVKTNTDGSVTLALYGVLYSSFVPSSGEANGSNPVIRGPPRYQRITLADAPDAQGNVPFVYVDFSLVHDASAGLAIKAALESSWPVSESYITLFALVDDAAWVGMIQSNQMNTHVWALAGPSMGVAVMAAIMGGPPIAYTGYIRNVFANNSVQNGTQIGPKVISSHGDPAQNYLVSILKSDNVVENVEMISAKVALCMRIQIPIVIPYTSFDGAPLSAALREQRKASAWEMNFIGEAFTMADASDGVNYADGKPIFMLAETVGEAMTVGCFGAIGYMTLAGKRYGQNDPKYAAQSRIDDEGEQQGFGRATKIIQQRNVQKHKQEVRKQSVAHLPENERKEALARMSRDAAIQRLDASAQRRNAKLAQHLTARRNKIVNPPRRPAVTKEKAKKNLVGAKGSKKNPVYAKQHIASARGKAKWEAKSEAEKQVVRDRLAAGRAKRASGTSDTTHVSYQQLRAQGGAAAAAASGAAPPAYAGPDVEELEQPEPSARTRRMIYKPVEDEGVAAAAAASGGKVPLSAPEAAKAALATDIERARNLAAARRANVMARRRYEGTADVEDFDE